MSYTGPDRTAMCDYCLMTDVAGKLFKPWTSPMEPNEGERVHVCEGCLRVMVTAAMHGEPAPPAVMPKVFRDLCREVSDRCAADTRLALAMAEAVGDQAY